MAKLNIQKAIAMGYKPEEIADYLRANPQYITGKSPTTNVSKANNSMLLNLLPVIASIAGGAIGAPLGPMGLIAGSAIGSGLGEAGRQGLSGEESDFRKIGTESLLGAAGGGAGVLLGGASKALRAGKAAAGSADDVAKMAARTKLSKIQTIKGEPYMNTAYRVLKGRNVQPRAADITREIVENTPGTLAPQKLAQTAIQRAQANKKIYDLTQTGVVSKVPVDTDKLLESINKVKTGGINLNKGTGKTLADAWLPLAKEANTVGKLSKLTEDVSNEVASIGIKNKEGRYLNAINTKLKAELKRMVSADDLFADLAKINAKEPIIQAQVNNPMNVFGLKTTIPTRLAEGARSILGDTATVGANTLGRPLGRQAMGQAGARMFLGGQTGGTPEGYEIPVDAANTKIEDYINSKTKAKSQTPKFNITPEQVAIAQLTMPKQQAAAVLAAYNVMNKNKAQSAMQESLDKAQASIEYIKTLKGQLGFGAVKGNLYETLLSGRAGGAGVPTDVVEKAQAFEILRIEALRAMQGARLSDQDIKQSEKWIPNIFDTDSRVRIKLKVLEELLTSLPSIAASTDSTSYYQTD